MGSSAIDETWSVDPADPHEVIGHHAHADGYPVATMPGTAACADRARLAAAAPEMARLLLELQEVDTSDGEYRARCPCCANIFRGEADGRPGQPYDVLPGKHPPSCRLVAVLRKAGVMP